MSYVPAPSGGDLIAVLGGVLVAGLGLAWWVRREDRDEADTPEPDPDDAPDHAVASTTDEPGPRHGASAV